MPAEEIAYSFDETSPSGYFYNALSPRYVNLNSNSPTGNLDSCIPNATDDELSTGQMTVGTLNTLKFIVDSRKNGTEGFEMDRPFFVGIGYHRPHEVRCHVLPRTG